MPLSQGNAQYSGQANFIEAVMCLLYEVNSKTFYQQVLVMQAAKITFTDPSHYCIENVIYNNKFIDKLILFRQAKKIHENDYQYFMKFIFQWYNELQ